MLEDENDNRRDGAMVQVRQEVACTREAIVDWREEAPSRCISDGTDQTTWEVSRGGGSGPAW